MLLCPVCLSVNPKILDFSELFFFLSRKHSGFFDHFIRRSEMENRILCQNIIKCIQLIFSL